MSSYFSMTGFKATVCASTEDKWHNCRWVELKTAEGNTDKEYGLQNGRVSNRDRAGIPEAKRIIWPGKTDI